MSTSDCRCVPLKLYLQSYASGCMGPVGYNLETPDLNQFRSFHKCRQSNLTQRVSATHAPIDQDNFSMCLLS